MHVASSEHMGYWQNSVVKVRLLLQTSTLHFITRRFIKLSWVDKRYAFEDCLFFATVR